MVIEEEATEVISVVDGGFEVHEEYFHAEADLGRLLRNFGFNGEFGEPADLP